MLLVTNGDSAAECIEGAALSAEVLPWRDVLHEGPVSAGIPNAELGEVRSRFIAARGGPTSKMYRRSTS
jgi:hypothetical protein